jgi:YebC/PmpR family DNA-binding regulatory protein
MAGHSKWANIKHRKGRQDAAKGKVFGKLIREITIASRMGGGDPAGNPRLRLALDKARKSSMSKDTIERAIAKGSGAGGENESLEEVTYEGYGPNGVAIMLEVITDHKGRTTPEIRHLFSKYGGNLGTDGCVGWLFETRGVIQVPTASVAEEKLIEVALDSGADDVTTEGDHYEVRTAFEGFDRVHEAIKAAGITPSNAEVTKIPTTEVSLQEDEARTVLKLLEMLEDHDDVQVVHSNFHVSDEIMAKLSE